MGVAGYIVLTYKFHKAGKRWTAHCEKLGTATFGRSLLEAQKRLEEAVLLHLNTLEDVGERERFFKENDIAFHHRKPKIEQIDITPPFDETTFVQPHIQPIRELATA